MSTNNKEQEKTIQLSQKAVSLIRELFVPKSNKDVSTMLSELLNIPQNEVSKIVDSLVKSEVLLEGNFDMRDQTAVYSEMYKDPDIQKLMLLDWHRTDSYKRALSRK